MTKADDFLALPYTRQIKRDEDGDLIATIVEFPGCVAHGTTDIEAFANLDAVARDWIELRISAGLDVPVPQASFDDLPSGKWVLRIARSLHSALIDLAKQENTSLNQLAASILAEAVGRRRAIGDFHASVAGKYFPEATSHYLAVLNEYRYAEQWRVTSPGSPLQDPTFITAQVLGEGLQQFTSPPKREPHQGRGKRHDYGIWEATYARH